VTRKALLAIALLGLGGCNWWYNEVPSPDDLMHHIPWFDHMIFSKAIQPYQGSDVPRNTPIGAVPVGGGEAEWGPAASSMMGNGFDTLVAKKLQRPANLVARHDSRSGEEVYNTYCAVCHSTDGSGAANAPVKEMGAKSLLAAEARGLPDGYIYSYIRYGNGLMPRYGDKIVRLDERWAVVDYVRSLQAKSAPPPPAAAPAKKGAH
jgi:mono/diheme cytochrome c family protein